MKVCDYIAAFLERQSVTHVHELVGGMITFLLDSIRETTQIEVISMHHEQAAAFAADGAGRVRGIPGIALATSGPGATNLLTGIGSCYFDSTPAVFITGQVNKHEMRGNRPIRQLGFQETDIVPMAMPITKSAVLVENPDDIPRLLEDAFRLAMSGRPGPVLIDIPMNVQRAEIGQPDIPICIHREPLVGDDKERDAFFSVMDADLRRAQRPLVLAGGGIRSARMAHEFRKFVEALQVPVAHSLMGVDLLPFDYPLRVGMIGSYGNRWANTALSDSDLLIVLGSRLDVRQTGADTESFKGGRKILHVDCEPGELNNRVVGCDILVDDLAGFLSAANGRAWTRGDFGTWCRRIDDLRLQWPDTSENRTISGINPNALMHALSAVSGSASAYVVDVGQHQMWAAQSLDLNADQRFLTSGGMGAMGFALPTAIGASLAEGASPTVVIAGDGSFQCNIQELQTIRRNGLPIKIVVINNRCHGMVRQFQESYFHQRFHSTVWGYDAPCFADVARAYGIDSAKVSQESEVPDGLAKLWETPGEPFLLEVIIPIETNAYPKMAFGKPISEMEPLSAPIEMEGT